MLPRRLELSLHLAQLVAVATLLRSIAFDRWITVLASILLLVGATAARRGRAWGIGLSFGAAMAFPVAFGILIAPPWFCLVGLIGALPFAFSLRAFARFDKGATALLAASAASAGALGAILWRQFAPAIFAELPGLRPSMEPHHGFLLAATIAMIVVVSRNHSRDADASEEEGARVRIGETLRFPSASAEEEAAEDELSDIGPPAARHATRR